MLSIIIYSSAFSRNVLIFRDVKTGGDIEILWQRFFVAGNRFLEQWDAHLLKTSWVPIITGVGMLTSCGC